MQKLTGLRRILRFVSFNIPIILIGFMTFSYPELIPEDLKTKVLGLMVIIIGFRF
jgi:hypothetical protein